MPILKRFLPLFLLGLLWAACDRYPKTDLSGIFPGSALADLESPTLRILGPLEGPWKLDQVLSPTLVSLSKDNMAQQFRLLGLHADEAPNPNAAAQGATQLEPEELRRLEEIQRFKVEGLTRVLQNTPLWVVRISDEQPPAAHIFIPQNPTASEQPGKKAILASARALREGVASMDLAGPDYELRETMLDCQFAAIAESLHETADRSESANIWSRFDLRLPPTEWDARIDAMDKALGLDKAETQTQPAA